MNATETIKRLRCGFEIYPTQLQAIEKIISSSLEKIPAQFILLTDSSGLVISQSGKNDIADPAELGALVAGDLAASQEMARLLGDFQTHQLILREGEQSNIWIVDAGKHLVLMIKVATSIPLGWTRLLIKRTAKLIASAIETITLDESTSQEFDFSKEDFSVQFNQSFEDLWK